MTEPLRVGRLAFRFQCQPGCTNCCSRPGDVFLTEEDITRIAAYLELEPAEFEKRYIEPRSQPKRLTTPRPRTCHFLVAGGCRIHEVKPMQCRVFPFWPENIETRAGWSSLRRYCPGVGTGPLVTIQSVREQAQAYHHAFPDI